MLTLIGMISLSSCHLARTSAFILNTIVLVGKTLRHHAIAEFLEAAIDRSLTYVFNVAASDTEEAVQQDIFPIDANGLMGMKRGDYTFLVRGSHERGSIEHRINIKSKYIIYKRANNYTPWEMTKESHNVIVNRLDMATAQVSLKKYGFDPGRIDGIWGENTSRAIAQFQRAVGFPVTGRLDSSTKNYLFERIH